jgi:hypothetical protein
MDEYFGYESSMYDFIHSKMYDRYYLTLKKSAITIYCVVPQTAGVKATDNSKSKTKKKFATKNTGNYFIGCPVASCRSLTYQPTLIDHFKECCNYFDSNLSLSRNLHFFSGLSLVIDGLYKRRMSGAVKAVATALNVYKKVAIIRGSDDSLTFEDPEGNVKTISDLHLAAVATVSQ